MFRLIRWVFLLAIIAALAGFLVGKPIHGKTAAESFCKLIDNPDCAKLAARGATEFAWLRSRWENASGGGTSTAAAKAPRKSADREPVAQKPDRPVATAEPSPAEPPAASAPPLDRHTVAERQALDKILSQRGSR